MALTFFTDHPASVNETYLEHAKCASGYARKLFLAAGAAAVHAVFPKYFETTASSMIRAMCDDIDGRKSAAEHCAEAEAEAAAAALSAFTEPALASVD